MKLICFYPLCEQEEVRLQAELGKKIIEQEERRRKEQLAHERAQMVTHRSVITAYYCFACIRNPDTFIYYQLDSNISLWNLYFPTELRWAPDIRASNSFDMKLQ